MLVFEKIFSKHLEHNIVGKHLFQVPMLLQHSKDPKAFPKQKENHELKSGEELLLLTFLINSSFKPLNLLKNYPIEA